MLLRNIFANEFRMFSQSVIQKKFPLKNIFLVKHFFTLKYVNCLPNFYRQNRQILTNNYYKFSNQTNKPQVNQQFINQSKEFFSKYVEDIVQLEKSSDWAQLIPNITQPLVIDFYADWCQPCKKLTPKLQQRIKKSNGKFKLLKVNIDKCGELATQLKIKSVPTVYFVFMGQGFDSFQGLVDDARLDKSFQTLQKIVEIANKQESAYQMIQMGKQLMKQNQFEKAEQVFAKFNEKGISDQLVALKEVLLSQCLLVSKKVAKFKDQIQKMKKFQDFYMHNPQLKQFYILMKSECQKISMMANQNPVVGNLKQKILSQPQNLNLKYELVEYYKSNDMIEECLQLAMQIVKQNKQWEDKKTNKYILAIFKQLGNASPLTQKYRKIFQRLLN